MDFSEALILLKNNHCVTRTGWNDDMFIALIEGRHIKKPKDGLQAVAFPNGFTIAPHIDLFTRNGTQFCSWQPTSTDLLANDWERCRP